MAKLCPVLTHCLWMGLTSFCELGVLSSCLPLFWQGMVWHLLFKSAHPPNTYAIHQWVSNIDTCTPTHTTHWVMPHFWPLSHFHFHTGSHANTKVSPYQFPHCLRTKLSIFQFSVGWDWSTFGDLGVIVSFLHLFWQGKRCDTYFSKLHNHQVICTIQWFSKMDTWTLTHHPWVMPHFWPLSHFHFHTGSHANTKVSPYLFPPLFKD